MFWWTTQGPFWSSQWGWRLSIGVENLIRTAGDNRAYVSPNPDASKDVIGFDMFVNWDLPIVICEGVFDAMAIRMNAIPLFGKSPQSELQKEIIGRQEL